MIIEIRTLLTNWKTKRYIDQCTYKRLYSDEDLPRSYGLIKIHKEGYPLRIIVSCIIPSSILQLF